MLSAGEEGLRKALITVGQEGVVTGGGLEKIEKYAKELMADGKATSIAKAMVMAEDQNPEWSEEYHREQQ